jgi:hypothetical protein
MRKIVAGLFIWDLLKFMDGDTAKAVKMFTPRRKQAMRSQPVLPGRGTNHLDQLSNRVRLARLVALVCVAFVVHRGAPQLSSRCGHTRHKHQSYQLTGSNFLPAAFMASVVAGRVASARASLR